MLSFGGTKCKWQLVMAMLGDPNRYERLGQVRLKAFDLLKHLQSLYGDNIPRVLLEKGFEFEGRKVP